MAEARHTSRKEAFFRINLDLNLTSRLVDVSDQCRQLLLHLRFPIQWLNECLSKANWKELMQRGQGLPSLDNTTVHFSQELFYFLLLPFSYLIFLLLTAYGGHE